MTSFDMDDEIDALFKLPIGEFTPARNVLAARFRKAGQQAQADAAKALPKPSVAAWIVNQLYWRHREPFDRLIEAGDRFRKSPGKREYLEARRNAQAALVPMATAVLHDAGYSDTRIMLRRVATTLEALSAYGSIPDAPRAGRLTAELALPGFEVLAGMMSPSGATRREVKAPPANTRSLGTKPAQKPAHRKDAREEERRRLAAAAKADVREGERALRAARAQAERTAAAFETAAKRAKESERRRVAAEKQLAKVVTEADAARERAREAEATAKKAALEAESSERLLEQARRKLEQLP